MSKKVKYQYQPKNKEYKDLPDGDGYGLSGMKEICQYVRRGANTVLDWTRTLDFPAKKIGGIWESDKKLVDEWRREQIQ